ncbi:MAG: hypothetical protein ABJN75_16465 [Hoeflea sp.]|uniref:hypothetical protein n=1 Tax=Hoeflea sp. TaxID=1940281 RepID=UPI0032998C8B|tara:strand:+ start:35047 stop:35478 length:432 start_codon:yes stop_codon:yes gene_type:complete
MTTDVSTTPMHAQHVPASAHTAAADPGETAGFAEISATPMPLDLVELELALDLNDVAKHGFCEAVHEAAKAVKGEFLFDLPASGLADNAQRIAVVCLSRDNGGRFGLVLLSADGDQARTIEPDETTADLVQFAKAFVAVLEKL